MDCRMWMKGQIIRKDALGEKFDIAELRENENEDLKNAV